MEESETKVNAAEVPSADGSAPKNDEKQQKCAKRKRILRRVLLITAIVLVALVIFMWVGLAKVLEHSISFVTGTPVQMNVLESLRAPAGS